MLTEEELQAELAARLESMERIRLSRKVVEMSRDAQSGKISPLEEACRRLGLTGYAVATSF